MRVRKKFTTTVRRMTLLLWKNILFRRKPLMIFLTILEIVAPTFLVGGLAWYRTIVDNDTGIKEDNFTYFSVYPEEDLLRPAKRKLNMKNTLFAYYPENELTREIMMMVKQRIGTRAELRSFQSEKELEAFVEDSEVPLADYKIRKEKIGAAIIFGPAFQVPNETLYRLIPHNPEHHRLNYTIRIPLYTIDTSHLVGSLQLPGPQHDNAQSYRGAAFTGIQIAMDKTIINFLTGEEPAAGISQEVFPYPPYDTTKFNTIFFVPMPAIIVIGFIFIVPSIMRNVVSERHTGIKELMKIMGLPNWMHWFGWMINTLLVLVFSISIVIFLLFYPIDEMKGGIVTDGDYTVWWFVMLLYVMAATAFCFFLSVFTTNPVMATTVGIVLWLLSYFLVAVPLALDYENLTLVKKVASSILPNTALHWAIGVMATLEGKGIGAHWWNLAHPGSTLDGVSLLHIIVMLIFDIIFYTSLAMYFENILPSKYGIRQPWYYPILPSTWFSVKTRNSCKDRSWEIPAEKPGFECEPGGLTTGISINNLSKKYGKKAAVNGISLKMYHGQITALLGHNGAGKTTTLSILTGLFPPSGGTASINGFDIRTELDRVRENLGLCPQHNMLFDDLTVLEHLTFFGRLKGLTSFEAHYEALSLIKKLQLKSKKHVAAGNLSGGQKRKLSLGLALIGGSKVVVLDEPTSGMDPEARRVIWDLLLSIRGERTIVLTTHFMEEADILGDRIAVMANGRIQCCGTPLYLKKYFGAGYILKLTVDKKTSQESGRNSILQIVKNHIPDGYVMKEENSGETSLEMSISIPCDETTGPKLPAMFKDLDGHKSELGIQTIGLSLSTIEDVFLTIEEHKTKDTTLDISDSNDNLKKNGYPVAGDEPQRRSPSIFKQIYGLMMKKTIYTLRKKRILLGQFLMPPVMIIVAILIFNTFYVPRENYPDRDITLSQYKEPVIVYHTDDDNIANKFEDVIGSMGKAVRVQNKTILKELEEVSVRDLGEYRDHYIVAADLNETMYHTLYSTIPLHAAPLSINLASNALLRSMSNISYTLATSFHPLHNLLFSKLEIVKPSRHHFMDGPIMLGIFVPIGLALFASSFLVFPTDERRTQAKQLQLMSGVHPITFWITSFVFDFTLMTLACCLMIAVIPIFGLERFAGTFTDNNALGALFLILVVYGYSAISFSYIFSLIFSSVSLAYSISTILHLATGLIMPLVIYILDTLVKAGGTGRLAARFVGRLFTTYGVSVSIMRYSSISILNSRCAMLKKEELDVICDPKNQIDANIRQCCSNCADLTNFEGIPQCFEKEQYFTWNYTMIDEKDFTKYIVPGIGQEMMYMVIMGLVYMIIILLIESISSMRNACSSKRTNVQGVVVNDDDVLAEQNRVQKLQSKSDDALVIKNLTKHFGNFAAVRNLNFGVHHGECFGLLGVNGAGKTTTFRMLTGDEHPTCGDAYSLSESLKGSRKQFLQNIGYCPQFDAIIGVLTGREMLKLFCHLRGVPSQDIDGQVNKWLRKLGLVKAGDVQCRNYSGGMKRRLSVGLAMIGDPPVVFLDEPTSGVDPVSRRQFWEVIASARGLGQSIVLTSHSMEECEALCQRLSIMVNGQLQCLGGVEHLKSKFAKGYTIVFRLKSNGLDPERVQVLKTEIEQTFTPCVLKDEHQNVIDYQVFNTEMTWDIIFGSMESFKEKYNDLIEDYTVSKTTLEEVFLSFAKLQHNGDRKVKGFVGDCFSIFDICD